MEKSKEMNLDLLFSWALANSRRGNWEPEQDFWALNGLVQFCSVQSLSRVWLFATPWTTACQASLSITNSQNLLKLMSIKSVMPSNHLILCHPLLLLLQHQSLQWIFRTDFLRMDWVDLLAVQGTLKSLLQHHSSKASILRCSAFFTVQLSHPYMTTGKTIVLTRWTVVDKVIFLLFNMLSRLFITSLTRSKRLLISWLQSPSAVILEPKKIVNHCFHCFPIYLPWRDGTRCHDLSFLNVEL